MGQCASAHARFGDSGPCVGSDDLYLATGAAAGRADREREGIPGIVLYQKY